MYIGVFFCRAGLNIIARYDLESRAITAQLPIDQSLYRGASSLFSTSYNYYDLAVDENGLWVIYAFKPQVAESAWPDSLLIAKLEPNYLDIKKTWNVTVSRQSFSNAFIAQGILYLLDSSTDKNTQFSFAYDLYSNLAVDISLSYMNVFGNNHMLAYDFGKKGIMAWDDGKITYYPIVSQ